MIEPHEDDPIIYTTDYGLDIKWGNAIPSSFIESLSSGNLKGFPYFTTSAEGKTYTWVLIGRNSNLTTSSMTAFSFSNWLNWTSKATLRKNFTNDTSTPAGIAINAENSKKYIVDSLSLNSLTGSGEIPSGCVLCMLNGESGSGTFASQKSYAWTYQSYRITWNVNNYSYSSSTIKNTMDGYYNNGSLGLSAIKSSISIVSLSTLENALTISTSGWGSRSFTSSVVSTNAYVFPLSSGKTNSNFKFSTYLTTGQFRPANTGSYDAVWFRDASSSGTSRDTYNRSGDTYETRSWDLQGYILRSYDGTVYDQKDYINNGDAAFFGGASCSQYYRPAFCLKV